MVPVGEAGHEHALEVGHDGAEGFRILRRRRGECGRDVARLDAREHRIFLRVLEIFGDPVHELVAVPPERRRVHVYFLCACR